MRKEATLKRNGIDHFIRSLTGEALKDKLYSEPSHEHPGPVLPTRSARPPSMPKSAEVKIDIRTVPNQDPDEMMQQIRDHLAAHGFDDLEVCGGHSTPALSRQARFSAGPRRHQNVEAAYGEPPIVLLMTPGPSWPMW